MTIKISTSWIGKVVLSTKGAGMYNVYFKERGVEIVPKSEGDIVEEPIWMLFKICAVL